MDQEPMVLDENEELRRVEAKIAALVRENNRLEYRLTSGAELRRIALVGIALAVAAAGASYWTALHGCEARTMRESELHARVHEERMADERAASEACLESSKKASADLSQCQEQRLRADMNDRFRMRVSDPGY